MTPKSQENAKWILKRLLQIARARDVVTEGKFYNNKRTQIPSDIVEVGQKAMQDAMDRATTKAIEELTALQ